jgi:predicted nucleotidyltransferase
MGLELLNEQIRTHSTRDEAARLQTREVLRRELARLVPGHRVWLYGSITKATRFREWSDVDLAFETAPVHLSLLTLMGLLRETSGREVDISLLSETRLKDKILREGELWTV